MIELRTLAYFVTACRCETLAGAAGKLGIALSTLSTALKVLETDVGLTLFRRINTGLYPTAQARWLMRHAEPLLACEAFARRWLAAPRRRQPALLTVEVGLSHTVSGVADAIQRAIHALAAERPDVLVNIAWIDESDSADSTHLIDGWPGVEQGRLFLGLADERARNRRHATVLSSDRWVFACRLPGGTRRPASASELAAGRLVVPALAQPLIEQVEHYLDAQEISGVRFVNEHPGELPRLIDECPDAALFVPESFVSPRLGLLRVMTVVPDRPLTMKIVALARTRDAVTSLFIRHLQRAFAGTAPASAPHPAISRRQIHYFNMVHRLRRISAAAHGCNVSQPSLSEQLHKLEGTLGRRLFERRGGGVIPNADGDRFAGVAKMIETGFRRITAGDAGAATQPGGRITVGILPSVSQHGLLVNRISEAVLAVQARHPDLKLVIREAPNGMLQDWVIRGLVGVAIVETGLPHMPRLPLGSSENLAAIVHSRHRLLPPGPVKLSDLIRLPLVLPSKQFGLRQLLDTAAEERDLKIQPAMEIDALTMIAAILERIPVCTVLPSSAVRRELDGGDLLAHPIIDPVILRRLFVIYSGERGLSEAERDLVNTLRSRLSDTQAPEPAAKNAQDSRK
jgi:DNA-binding transcriptional LysR family regulator